MNIKICASCKESKEFSDFGKNSSKKDGLQTFCKICCKKLNAEHYVRNKVKYKKNAVSYKKRIYSKIVDLKSNKKCVDCGNVYPHYVMDFDHLRDKKFQISKSFDRKSLKEILLEIEKCELVCSNCHRIRTHERRNSNTSLV